MNFLPINKKIKRNPELAVMNNGGRGGRQRREDGVMGG
jgi:hypothetical protein